MVRALAPAQYLKRKASAPISILTNEQLKALFLRCDKNKDGRLSREELTDAFRNLGAYFPSYRAQRALHCADENEDGYINNDEVDELVKYASQFGYTTT